MGTTRQGQRICTKCHQGGGRVQLDLQEGTTCLPWGGDPLSAIDRNLSTVRGTGDVPTALLAGLTATAAHMAPPQQAQPTATTTLYPGMAAAIEK